MNATALDFTLELLHLLRKVRLVFRPTQAIPTWTTLNQSTSVLNLEITGRLTSY